MDLYLIFTNLSLTHFAIFNTHKIGVIVYLICWIFNTFRFKISEIITLQLGQCGLNLGQSFWQSTLRAHGIDFTGSSSQSSSVNQSVFFSETRTGRFVPRALLINSSDPLTFSQNRSLFDPKLAFNLNIDPILTWAKGHYTTGAEHIDEITDTVRYQVESCDHFQGFQFINSISGGTGSGLGTLLMCRLKEQYPDKMIETHSVLASGDDAIECYNNVFSLNQMTENCDLCYVYDNASIQTIIKSENLEDVNMYLGNVISKINEPYWQMGENGSDMRKVVTSLVCFPRLHYFVSLFSEISKQQQDIVVNLFDTKYCLFQCDIAKGKVISNQFIASYDVNQKTFAEQVGEIDIKYVDFSQKCHLFNQIPSNSSFCLNICSHTALSQGFGKILEVFKNNKKENIKNDLYSGEGMDSMEFEEVIGVTEDLCCEYVQYECLDGSEQENDE